MIAARIRAGEIKFLQKADEVTAGDRPKGWHLRDGMHIEINTIHDRDRVMMRDTEKHPALKHGGNLFFGRLARVAYRPKSIKIGDCREDRGVLFDGFIPCIRKGRANLGRESQSFKAFVSCGDHNALQPPCLHATDR